MIPAEWGRYGRAAGPLRNGLLLRRALAETGVPLHDCASLEEAVTQARTGARLGDAVLLSPACASFDMFSGYEARGEAFRSAVRDRASGNV